MKEMWLQIEDYPGYEVASTGRVRSVDRQVTTGSGIRRYAGKIIAPTRNQHGHLKVALRSSQGKVYRYVHSLVAEAFIGPRPQGMEVAHADGHPVNNNLANLRYATPAENAADKVGHGTALNRGRHPRARLGEAEVSAIRQALRDGKTQRAVAEEHGVSRTTVSAIATGRSWREP